MSASDAVVALNEPLSNTNILSESTLVTPAERRRRYPRSARATATVEAGRAAVNAILAGEDTRRQTIRLEAQPTVSTAVGPIRYPGTISIDFPVGG